MSDDGVLFQELAIATGNRRPRLGLGVSVTGKGLRPCPPTRSMEGRDSESEEFPVHHYLQEISDRHTSRSLEDGLLCVPDTSTP